jgi:hypothetical protein
VKFRIDLVRGDDRDFVLFRWDGQSLEPVIAMRRALTRKIGTNPPIPADGPVPFLGGQRFVRGGQGQAKLIEKAAAIGVNDIRFRCDKDAAFARYPAFDCVRGAVKRDQDVGIFRDGRAKGEPDISNLR